jgi:hypothetical protein
VGAEALKGTAFAVFGCGNSLYEDDFNKVCRPSPIILGVLSSLPFPTFLAHAMLGPQCLRMSKSMLAMACWALWDALLEGHGIMLEELSWKAAREGSLCAEMHLKTEARVHPLQVAKTVDGQLGSLGGQRIRPCGLADEDAGSLDQQFEAWTEDLLGALQVSASRGNALPMTPSQQPAMGSLSDGYVLDSTQNVSCLWRC